MKWFQEVSLKLSIELDPLALNVLRNKNSNRFLPGKSQKYCIERRD